MTRNKATVSKMVDIARKDITQRLDAVVSGLTIATMVANEFNIETFELLAHICFEITADYRDAKKPDIAAAVSRIFERYGYTAMIITRKSSDESEVTSRNDGESQERSLS